VIKDVFHIDEIDTCDGGAIASLQKYPNPLLNEAFPAFTPV
jgi:hypothetical protein